MTMPQRIAVLLGVCFAIVAWFAGSSAPTAQQNHDQYLRYKIRGALTLLPRYSEREDADGTHNMEWDTNGPYLRYDDLQGWLGAEVGGEK